MKVIEFIKQYSLESLTEVLAISVKKVDDLLVLNYNQIDSPKTDPIVMECRSLILEAGSLKVVSRGFDRFFNYGEALNVTPEIDWNRAVAYEKVDGSLIKIYNHKGHWYISTRGTAYAESDCMGYGVTFEELVWKALGVANDAEFQKKCFAADLWDEYTYIFELTSVENRVVKRYEGYKLYYLSARINETGDYARAVERVASLRLGAIEPKCFTFNTIEDCLRTSRELKDLDEGYVIYQDGVPISKVKSPAYVAVHHIRGEGLNPKRIMQLVLVNEQDEYLQYFPEDAPVFVPYVTAKEQLDLHLNNVWNATKWIDNQKDFALEARKYPFQAALFQARSKGISAVQAFNDQRESYKMDILKGYVA